MLSYVYIPVIQNELDLFQTCVWNNHRIKKQRQKELSTGIPEHIYTCPQKYGGRKCGYPLTEQDLQEVAELSCVLDNTDDYLKDSFRN